MTLGLGYTIGSVVWDLLVLVSCVDQCTTMNHLLHESAASAQQSSSFERTCIYLNWLAAYPLAD